MPIDNERYQEYRDELNDQLRGLDAREQYRTLQAKLLDYVEKNNLSQADALELRRVTRQLLDDELSSFADRILQNFDRSARLVNDLYDDLGDNVDRSFARVQSIERATSAELGNYKEGVTDEITRQLRQGLAQDEGVDALQKRIAPISKKASYYSGTIAQTGVKAQTRALKTEKARVAGVYMYEYVGLLRSTTRPFCRTMLGSTHHISDIRQMSNGNREPVITYCGGWNCIHDWEPDPFADEEQGAQIQREQDGNATVRIPDDANLPDE
jgi:predicted XRE-type DNA-binding protein